MKSKPNSWVRIPGVIPGEISLQVAQVSCLEGAIGSLKQEQKSWEQQSQALKAQLSLSQDKVWNTDFWVFIISSGAFFSWKAPPDAVQLRMAAWGDFQEMFLKDKRKLVKHKEQFFSLQPSYFCQFPLPGDS